MKAIKFMAMLLTAATMTFGAASCGDDDDEKSAEVSVEELMDAKATKATLKGTDTSLQLDVTFGKKYYTSRELAKFRLDPTGEKELTEWTNSYTLPSAKLAKEVYDALLAELIEEEGQESADKMVKATSLSQNIITLDYMKIEDVANMGEYAYDIILELMLDEVEYAEEEGASVSISGVETPGEITAKHMKMTFQPSNRKAPKILPRR